MVRIMFVGKKSSDKSDVDKPSSSANLKSISKEPKPAKGAYKHWLEANHKALLEEAQLLRKRSAKTSFEDYFDKRCKTMYEKLDKEEKAKYKKMAEDDEARFLKELEVWKKATNWVDPKSKKKVKKEEDV